VHLTQSVESIETARSANERITKLTEHFDVDSRKNVDFVSDDYRRYAERVRDDIVGVALASTLTDEWPQK
jgi:hypothetical protein